MAGAGAADAREVVPTIGIARRVVAGGAVALLALSVTGTARANTVPEVFRAVGRIGGDGLTRNGLDFRPAPGVPAPPTGIQASAWLVADLNTGQVLAALAPHHRWRPASTLKVLTALTVIPRLRLDTEVRATEAEAAVQGSAVGIVPHYSYRVSQLLEGMLVVSGNDAALALAAANGGTARTIAEMNAEARHLQADDTVARTVDGLDAPGQFSSCYDLALIARAALRLATFRFFDSIVRAEFPAPRHKHFQIYTHNPLLGVYPGTFGVKNGYTVKDDASYIGAVRRGGRSLIVVLLHANPEFAPSAEKLLTWGFRVDGRARPVGVLVPPLGSPTRARHTVRPSAAGPTVVRHSDRAWELAAASAAAAVLLACVALVTVHRRRRRRRLALPHW